MLVNPLKYPSFKDFKAFNKCKWSFAIQICLNFFFFFLHVIYLNQWWEQNNNTLIIQTFSTNQEKKNIFCKSIHQRKNVDTMANRFAKPIEHCKNNSSLVIIRKWRLIMIAISFLRIFFLGCKRRYALFVTFSKIV